MPAKRGLWKMKHLLFIYEINFWIYYLFRCKRESAGPSFLLILGHKYGFRPMPQSILKDEFDKLLAAVDNKDILNEMYQLDNNAVPPVYVLTPR